MRILRTAILWTCLALVFAPGSAVAATRYKTATVKIDASHNLNVASSKGSMILLGVSSGPNTMGSSEKRYRYAVGSKKKPLATANITVRSLPTTSEVVFAKVTTPKRTVPITMVLTGGATTAAAHPFGLKADLTYDIHFGVDRTSGPWGWADLFSAGTLDRSVFLSKAYRYRPLTKKYSGGGVSYIRSLVSESNLVSVVRQKNGTVGLSTGLVAGKDICERYFIVSPRATVDTSTSASIISRVTAKEWRWVDGVGAYQKSGYSEPNSKTSYAIHMGSFWNAETRDYYLITGSGLLENLLLNDAYTLALIRSPDGLWRTNYTSMWVKGESGIHAPYVDTHHNDAIAALGPKLADALDAHGITAVDPARAWAAPYGLYLAARAAKGQVIRTAHGYFFPDYYDSTGRVKVHSSLNHTMDEMCYLFWQSGATSSTPQFACAMNIKAAIDDCGTNWIAPAGRTYYQRNVNGQYAGLESLGLSYGALRSAQGFLQYFVGTTDPVFDKLIACEGKQLGITTSSVSGSDRSSVTPPTNSEVESLLASGDSQP